MNQDESAALALLERISELPLDPFFKILGDRASRATSLAEPRRLSRWAAEFRRNTALSINTKFVFMALRTDELDAYAVT